MGAATTVRATASCWPGFDGETWSTPRALDVHGTLYPSFTIQNGAPVLLYRRAAPAGWSLIGMDSEGNVHRRVDVSGNMAERPIIHDSGSETVLLRWPLSRQQREATWSPTP